MLFVLAERGMLLPAALPGAKLPAMLAVLPRDENDEKRRFGAPLGVLSDGGFGSDIYLFGRSVNVLSAARLFVVLCCSAGISKVQCRVGSG